MNILFVHEVDWRSKVVFDIHNMAELLASRGHNVYAIDYENQWRLRDLFRPGSFKTTEFPGISRAMPGASVTLRHPGFVRLPILSRLTASCAQYREIQRTIREKSIDAIMLYAVPTSGISAIRLARAAGIPVIFRSIDILHELVPHALLRPATRLLEKQVYRHADRILAITPNHARYVQALGAPPERVKTMLYPIDTAIFQPGPEDGGLRGKCHIEKDAPVILFIGTLFGFSGLDRFLRAFPEISRAVPESRLLIVGDGPQRPTLEALIDKLGLAKQVTITGFQPYQTMPLFIRLASVCINTFLDTPATRDIFPGKIIQYLACGKPAVATPLAGITSLVPDESAGIIYAASPEAMTAPVIELLKNPARREQVGRAGAEYVKAHHDQQAIARQLEAEISELVSQNRR
ncbi:glycosyltransferase family 4 protein [Chloroflexota bacterium]